MKCNLFYSHYAQSILRFLGLTLVCTLLTLPGGCTFLDKCSSMTSAIGGESVGRVDIVFPGNIHIVDDTVTPGRQIPGLSGRVWLFAEDGKSTLAANGPIEVELWDMTPLEKGGQAVKKVDWKFRASDVKKLRRNDQVGTSYAVFLPWEDYQPDIKKVQLRLTYVDEHGVRHNADPSVFNVRGVEQPPLVRIERRSVLANTLPPQK